MEDKDKRLISDIEAILHNQGALTETVSVDYEQAPRIVGMLMGKLGIVYSRYRELLAQAGALAERSCLECRQPAEWVRRTQYAGDHYYCDQHARAEKDFGKESPGYFTWERLEPVAA